MKQQIKSSLILLLTATIWGVAFVAQSVGMEYIGPFTFNAIRCVLGGLVLIPVILVLKKKKETGAENQEKEDKKTLWAGGIACGVILCIASNLQQFGIMEASVGKSGFFTALYIVMIPVIGIFIGKRPGIKLWFCVALAVVGMYLLCMKDGSFTIERADIMLLLCALVFSFHILVVDYFSPKVDGVKNVLYTVFCMRSTFSSRNAVYRDTGHFQYSGGMAAFVVCGTSFLRRWLYLADCRTERHQPGYRIPYYEPGIRDFRTGWLGNLGTGIITKRNFRLRIDVCGNYYHADSHRKQENRLILRIVSAIL